MKKNVIKTAFAAVCVVAAGLSGFKAYNVADQSKAEMLLAQNVEALSQGEPWTGKSITPESWLEAMGITLPESGSNNSDSYYMTERDAEQMMYDAKRHCLGENVYCQYSSNTGDGGFVIVKVEDKRYYH